MFRQSIRRPAVEPAAGGAPVGLQLAPRAAIPGGTGRRLPDGLREKLEHAYGAQLDTVRVHAGRLLQPIGALAFTRGAEIYVAPAAYRPWSRQGQLVLAHEVAHVLQQRQPGRVPAPAGGRRIVERPKRKSTAKPDKRDRKKQRTS